jgi:hypothetical protein
VKKVYSKTVNKLKKKNSKLVGGEKIAKVKSVRKDMITYNKITHNPFFLLRLNNKKKVSKGKIAEYKLSNLSNSLLYFNQI